MLWFSVWTVLVVGTLVGAVLLGRRLWRSAVAAGRELARAGEVLGELEAAVARLEAAAQERPPVRPTLLADPAPLRARVEELRAARGRRREERAVRHARTAQSWRRYSH